MIEKATEVIIGSEEELRMREALMTAMHVMDPECISSDILVKNFASIREKLLRVCRGLYADELKKSDSSEGEDIELGQIPEGLELEALLSLFGNKYMANAIRCYVEQICEDERGKLLFRFVAQKAHMHQGVLQRINNIILNNGLPEAARVYISSRLYEYIAQSFENMRVDISDLEALDVTFASSAIDMQGMVKRGFENVKKGKVVGGDEFAAIPANSFKIRITYSFGGTSKERGFFVIDMSNMLNRVVSQSDRFDDMQTAAPGDDVTMKFAHGDDVTDGALLLSRSDYWYEEKGGPRDIVAGSEEEKTLIQEARGVMRTAWPETLKLSPDELRATIIGYAQSLVYGMQMHEALSESSNSTDYEPSPEWDTKLFQWLSEKLMIYKISDLADLLCSEKVLFSLGENIHMVDKKQPLEAPSLSDDVEALLTFRREAIPLIRRMEIKCRVQTDRRFMQGVLNRCYGAAQKLMVGRYSVASLGMAKEEGFPNLDKLLAYYLSRYSVKSIAKACSLIQSDERLPTIPKFLHGKISWDHRGTWRLLEKAFPSLQGKQDQFTHAFCDLYSANILAFCDKELATYFNGHKVLSATISVEDLYGIDVEIVEKEVGLYLSLRGSFRRFKDGDLLSADFQANVPISVILADKPGLLTEEIEEQGGYHESSLVSDPALD